MNGVAHVTALLYWLFVHVVHVVQVDKNSGEDLEPLPEGWKEDIDPDSGHTYYFNTITGEHLGLVDRIQFLVA